MSRDITNAVSLPLFSSRTIIDYDIGVLRYVRLMLPDPNYFIFDQFDNWSFFDLIHHTYDREDINPLSIIMRNRKDKDFIDEAYVELMEKSDELIKFSVTTEIANLIQLYSTSGDIVPSILYYTEKEKESLEKFLPSGVDYVYIEDFKDYKLSEYSAIYLQKLAEADPFKESMFKSFYFSSSGYNVEKTETEEIMRDQELINYLIKKCNLIGIFDMYKRSVIDGTDTEEPNDED